MDNWLGKVLEGVFGVEVEYEGRCGCFKVVWFVSLGGVLGG